jgi:hypothetical protein
VLVYQVDRWSYHERHQSSILSLAYIKKEEYMSLDVTLYYVNDSHEVEVFNRNITHNLNKMAMELGAYEYLWRPEEVNIDKASKLIPHLEKCLVELTSNPDKYKEFNPKNGWGTYEGLIVFIKEYLDACIEYPNALVSADR